MVRTFVLGAASWLMAGAAATWFLTHPSGARYEDPAPNGARTVRLRTGDGLTLGAWLAPPRLAFDADQRSDAARNERSGEGMVTARHPDGTCVVLLHGIRGRRSQLRARFEALVRRGHCVLSVSMRAHGDSDGEFVDAGYSAAADVLAAVDYLGLTQPRSRIIVWGYSMGAAAALFAAPALGERVHAYVLEAPYANLAKAIDARIRIRVPPPLAALAYADVWLFAHAAPTHFDDINPADQVRQIPRRTRVLFVTGALDQRAPSADVYAMAAAHPRARVVRIADAGHDNAFPTHRERYWEALDSLLIPSERARPARQAR